MRFLPLFLGLAFLGCSDKDAEPTDEADTDTDTDADADADADTDSDTDTDVPTTANLRAIHLAPDAGEVDVFLNDTSTSIVDFPFGGAIDYIPLPGDTYNIKVSPAGGTIDDAVIAADVPLVNGTNTTVVAYGTVANGTITAAIIDDNVTDLAEGSTRYNIWHVADGIGLVDVVNTDDSNAILLEGVDFGDNGILDLPAGAYNIGLDVEQDGSVDAAFSVPALEADATYNVFAVNAGGVKLFALGASGQASVIEPDAP